MAKLWEHDSDPSTLACRICRISLHEMEMPDGSKILSHARPWDEYDHEPDPVPSVEVVDRRLVCDFCGKFGSEWAYHGASLAQLGAKLKKTGVETKQLAEIDGLWYACDECDPYVRRGHVDGLWQNWVKNSSKIPDDDLDDPARYRRQVAVWKTYISSIRHREPLVRQQPLSPMRPAQMPKIRDRLIEFWNGPIARGGIARDLRQAAVLGQEMNLPGYLAGDPTRFSVPVTRMSYQQTELLIERVVNGLEMAQLNWISERFTNLAITAAKRLNEVNVDEQELPAENGLIIWADPIADIVLPDTGQRVPVRGAAWALIPRGVWVTVYIPPESGHGAAEPQRMRDEIGWLVPWSSGGGAPFGEHESADENDAHKIIRTLVATWLLIKQPGLAEITEEPVLAETKRKYKRAGRPVPKVRIVELRRRERKTKPGEQPGRVLRYAVKVGWDTGGFWRTYWVGQGREQRDRRFIAPYIARDDLPFRPDDEDGTTTVHVLR